ncbi:ATP-binding protein [Sphingobacterium faecium]|uniref:ATP-binding protein n=1 Tax=Sphingobacterium faecium TaxID=34087 RepID=UPI0021B65127|nr:ATP-binding protein [Sphingobacterium faecium]UXD71088.1 ATP-binding protein [Sphingobacterium faecium]
MINLINNNEKLTPYVFYSRLLKDAAISIKENADICFKLVENGDENLFESNYNIEPISIPLVLSLIEQLSKFYSKPINLSLYNNIATKKVLSFLFKSDFFYVAGNNKNPTYPIGRNILKFKEAYLGDFIKNNPRPEHKVRCYSLQDHGLSEELERFDSEESKRDFLISEYIYIVRDHFQALLFDNENTVDNADLYVEILSELITNGVLHSNSDTFALMFVNKFATKFSISDNGIGFTESLKNKQKDLLYDPLELRQELDRLRLLSINDKILENFNYIIETLYYSSLKDRKGLFDLMLSVVLGSEGYFRLHSENSQIIISSRMVNELSALAELRNRLFNLHREKLVNGDRDGIIEEMIIIKNTIKSKFIVLYQIICKRYNEDYRYSSLRFFNVKFRGVHIEVEIPNNKA